MNIPKEGLNAWATTLQRSGRRAKDNLDAIVKGGHPLPEVYNMKSDGPDGGKADFLRDMANDYRILAQEKLKEEFPSINAEVETLRLDAVNTAVQ